MKSKPLAALVISLIFVANDQLGAQAAAVLTPPGSETVEGDTSYNQREMRYRYQQVFESSYFSDLAPGGGFIRTFYLRGDDLPGGAKCSF